MGMDFGCARFATAWNVVCNAELVRGHCKSFQTARSPKGEAMKIDTFLVERNCQFERLPHSPTYSAQRLAQELHVPGQEEAKTVLLRSSSGSRFVVAVLPASKSIDLAAASKLVGKGKLHLATELEIGEHCPDCEFGVLPPFGSR
jgi:Ala-tRNA(Pro) deacylase